MAMGCLPLLFYSPPFIILSSIMKHYFTLATLTFCLLLSACSISGIFTDYNQLTQEEKEKVVKCTEDISKINDFNKLYVVNVAQIKQFITEKQNVVVYSYVPFCTSKNCISPKTLIDDMKAKGYSTLIVSDTYADAFISVGSNFPLLMIDNTVYKTKLRGKYTELFHKDLLGVPLKSINYASYHLFQNGKYVKSYQNYKEIE